MYLTENIVLVDKITSIDINYCIRLSEATMPQKEIHQFVKIFNDCLQKLIVRVA